MSARTRVLLAHFDRAERERIARMLAEAGAEVLVAEDGAAALELAAVKAPGFALLACMLPVVSGFEACRKLGEANGGAGIPCLLLADADDPYVRARARHVGAKRVLVGSVHAPLVRELLATSWAEVDPLELAAERGRSSRADLLFRDLLGAPEPGAPESLIARVSDPLTGLVASDYLELKLQEECKRCARYGQPLSLLVAQIGGFDRIVERHGRAAGDEALLEVAGVFLCESRDVDVAGRAGAARFHLLLPNTAADGARALAARILGGVRARRLASAAGEIELDLQIGLATLAGGSKTEPAELVRAAEQDLAAGGDVPVEPLPEPDPKSAKSR